MNDVKYEYFDVQVTNTNYKEQYIHIPHAPEHLRPITVHKTYCPSPARQQLNSFKRYIQKQQPIGRKMPWEAKAK